MTAKQREKPAVGSANKGRKDKRSSRGDAESSAGQRSLVWLALPVLAAAVLVYFGGERFGVASLMARSLLPVSPSSTTLQFRDPGVLDVSGHPNRFARQASEMHFPTIIKGSHIEAWKANRWSIKGLQQRY